MLVALIIGCITISKDHQIPQVYEDIKSSLDEILNKHNNDTLKSKNLKLTLNIQHLNRNETDFKAIKE